MIPKNTQISIEEIDKLNIDNWLLRYEKPHEIIKQSKQLILQSKNISYLKGLHLATLNKLVCEFLLSEHNENIITELFEIISYFESKEEDAGYIHVLNLTANIFQSYGNYSNAIEVCKKGQKLAVILGDKIDLADNYSICGLIYSDLFDYKNAIKSFNKAFDIRTEINDEKAIASSLNLIARTYSLSGNYESALSFYNKAFELRKRMNDTGGLPWTHIGMASTYEKMKNYDAASKQYEIALNLNKKHKDKRCNLHCYFGIGTVESIINPTKIAEGYLLEAMKIAKELASKPMLYKIYKKLSELYERLNDNTKAFVFYKTYHSIKEEVVNAKMQNTIKNMEIVFATEKSKKEIEIHQLKNIQLKDAYNQIEQKNLSITASINYAKNIQTALLPSIDYIESVIPDSFILFKPRDIVSGDFYWLNKVNNKIIIVAADCTGHGIPGAFMSMLGISFLDEIVNKNKITQPDLILNELRKMVIRSLNKTDKEVKDGMDIALVTINIDSLELEYSGAYNQLFIYRPIKGSEESDFFEIKADRMPIGKYIKEDEPFTNKSFQLQKNDSIYIYSDGYPDQFGGEKDEKFKIRRLKVLLSEIQKKSMEKQKEILDQILTTWQGDNEQTDDIIIMGIRF